MGLLSHLLSAGVGYAVSEMSDSHPVRDYCDRKFGNKTLEDTIRDYARERQGIYGCNNLFAYELHKIAKSFEEFDFDETYGKLL